MRTAISAEFAGIVTLLRLRRPPFEAGKHFLHGVKLAHLVDGSKRDAWVASTRSIGSCRGSHPDEGSQRMTRR